MKKQLKFILLLYLIFVSLLFGRVVYAQEDSTVVKSEEELLTAIENSENISLGEDISLTKEVDLENREVQIIGNGFTISMEEKNQVDATNLERAMFVLKNTNLTLSNIKLDGKNNSRIFYVDAKSILDAKSDVTLIQGCASTKNNVNFAGQCIYNLGQVDFTGKIEVSYRGSYGIIYNNGGFVTKNSSFTNLKTVMGGVFYNDENGNTTIEDCKITSAIGSLGYGSAISNLGTLSIINSEITECKYVVNTVYNEGTLTMDNCKVTDNENTAIIQEGQSGGILVQKKGKFTMTNSQVLNNKTASAGGVMVDGGIFIMDGENSQIAKNVAEYLLTSSMNASNFGNGGGVFLNNGTFEMRAGSICENEAKFENNSEREVEKSNGYGGGIFINGGNFTMLGGTISDNKAYKENTEGIYLNPKMLGSSAKDKASLNLSGSAKVMDPIYLAYNQVITILDKLAEDVSYSIVQENTNIGATVAVYQTEESIQDNDAKKFISTTTKKQYELLKDEGKIVLEKQDLSKCTIKPIQTIYEYTGKTITPDVQIYDIDGKLIRGYDITGERNVGKKVATITGDGYTTIGTAKVEYEILKRNLNSKGISVSLDKQAYSYTGKGIIPTVTVKNNSTLLKEDTDYTVLISNNVKAGTGQVVITGIGNYTGKLTKTFSIKKKQTISCNGYKKSYTTKSFNLNAKTNGNGKLTYSSSNIKVATVDAKGNVKLKGIGTAKITVKAAATNTYFVTSKTVSIIVVKGTQTLTGKTSYSKVYGNKAFKLNIKRTTGNGKLSYKSSNKKVVKVDSKGKVTIVGRGKATITVTAKSTSLYNESNKKITITVRRG